MTRTLVARLAAAAACGVLLVPLPASSATAPTGVSATANTILAVTAGSKAVSVGTDLAESEDGASPRAHALFIAGVTGGSSVGAAERTATKKSHTGASKVTEGTFAVGELLRLTVADASASAEIDDARVASSVDGTLAAVDILTGLISLDGIVASSATEVTSRASSATRSVSLNGVSLLDLGELLEELGVDPLGLACEAVEATGGSLGVNTSEACEHLGAAEGAIADAAAALASAEAGLDAVVTGLVRDDVQADRDAAAALSCDPLDAACIASALATLLALAAEYDITPSDPTNLTATKDEVVAGLDRILAAFDDLAVVQDGRAALDDAGCDEAAAAIDDVIVGLSDEDPAGVEADLAPIGAALDTACASLQETLDTLLGTPLLTLDDVQIDLSAVARPDDPEATVTASIGSITVGLSEVDIPGTLENAEALTTELVGTLGGILDDLGIGLPAPRIDLFAIATDSGRRGDGTWFADASVTTLRIEIPSATLELADAPPLGILGDGPGAGVFRAAATVTTPPLGIDAVVFDAASDFTEGSADDDGDGSGGRPAPANLPKTGLPVQVAMIAGAGSLAAAAGLRFFLRVR